MRGGGVACGIHKQTMAGPPHLSVEGSLEKVGVGECVAEVRVQQDLQEGDRGVSSLCLFGVSCVLVASLACHVVLWGAKKERVVYLADFVYVE